MKITKEYLQKHPDHIFVFGDNTKRKGKKGAAELRDEPNTYGFITKKFPSFSNTAYFKPGEYSIIFELELSKLINSIKNNPKKTYLITPLGSGLANKYGIWEKVIKPGLECLKDYSNVVFLYE